MGDDIVVEENKDLTPAKVINVWSQVMKGNHCFLHSAMYFPVILLLLVFPQFANIVVATSLHGNNGTLSTLLFLYQTQ